MFYALCLFCKLYIDVSALHLADDGQPGGSEVPLLARRNPAQRRSNQVALVNGSSERFSKGLAELYQVQSFEKLRFLSALSRYYAQTKQSRTENMTSSHLCTVELMLSLLDPGPTCVDAHQHFEAIDKR